MSKWKRWVLGTIVTFSLGLSLVATPMARADEYFDNGLNPYTGIGYVYQTRGPNEPTIVWWYDAYGNYGVAWLQ